jgi:hypothetical protein
VVVEVVLVAPVVVCCCRCCSHHCMHFIGIMEALDSLCVVECLPCCAAMSSAYDRLMAMPLEPLHPEVRWELDCEELGVAAPLPMPPWLGLWGEDCAEHIHDHACIRELVYMLVAARRSSCAAVRRFSYAAVRRSSCSAVRRSSCSAVRRSSCAAVRRSSRPVL